MQAAWFSCVETDKGYESKSNSACSFFAPRFNRDHPIRIELRSDTRSTEITTRSRGSRWNDAGGNNGKTSPRNARRHSYAVVPHGRSSLFEAISIDARDKRVAVFPVPLDVSRANWNSSASISGYLMKHVDCYTGTVYVGSVTLPYDPIVLRVTSSFSFFAPFVR